MAISNGFLNLDTKINQKKRTVSQWCKKVLDKTKNQCSSSRTQNLGIGLGLVLLCVPQCLGTGVEVAYAHGSIGTDLVDTRSRDERSVLEIERGNVERQANLQ